jgi:hypothetical protein
MIQKPMVPADGSRVLDPLGNDRSPRELSCVPSMVPGGTSVPPAPSSTLEVPLPMVPQCGKAEPSLALCLAPHPFGVTYRLQGPTDQNNPTAPELAHRRLFCPWCDWTRLRMAGREDTRPDQNKAKDLA